MGLSLNSPKLFAASLPSDGTSFSSEPSRKFRLRECCSLMEDLIYSENIMSEFVAFPPSIFIMALFRHRRLLHFRNTLLTKDKSSTCWSCADWTSDWPQSTPFAPSSRSFYHLSNWTEWPRTNAGSLERGTRNFRLLCSWLRRKRRNFLRKRVRNLSKSCRGVNSGIARQKKL